MASGRAGPAGTEPDQIFSDDENEKKFIKDICWIAPDHWIRSDMKWNTIHGMEWRRVLNLGEGGYGLVSVGQRRDGMLFAVKSIPVGYPLTTSSKKKMQVQINEIKMMRYLRSKYIIRCLGCGRSSAANGLFGQETLDVFMEYSVRGSLRSIFEKRNNVPFEEHPFLRQYTYDLLKALQYMRTKRIVHGDIKMANILLGDDCVKLADWGGAKRLDRTNLKKRLIGTTGFRSPEVIYHYQQGYPADIFSLGCTVIEMATGNMPEQVVTRVMGLNQFTLYGEADIAEVRIPQQLSPECGDFLKHCLCQKLEDRWTASELLSHPFIANRDRTTNLPYSIQIDPSLTQTLLRPPRLLDPELPDETISRRVINYLTQTWYPQAGYGGFLSAFGPPSPQARNLSPDPIDLVANFVPDFYVKRQAGFPPMFPGDNRSYEPPVSAEHILVPTPVASPTPAHINLSSGSGSPQQRRKANRAAYPFQDINLNSNSGGVSQQNMRNPTPFASPRRQPNATNLNNASPHNIDWNSVIVPNLPDLNASPLEGIDWNTIIAPNVIDLNISPPNSFDWNMVVLPNLVDHLTNVPLHSPVHSIDWNMVIAPNIIDLNTNPPNTIDLNINPPNIIDLNTNPPNIIDLNTYPRNVIDMNVIPATDSVTAQDFIDAMLQSTSFMVGVNNQLYDEAIAAAAQSPAPNIIDMNLFPHVQMSGSPEITTVSQTIAAYFPVMMCQGVEAVQPGKKKAARSTSRDTDAKSQARSQDSDFGVESFSKIDSP